MLLGTIWGFFIHPNVGWRFGWLEWIVSTPHFHHRHYTQEDHIDRNYASMLSIMDVLFGTRYLPKTSAGKIRHSRNDVLKHAWTVNGPVYVASAAAGSGCFELDWCMGQRHFVLDEPHDRSRTPVGVRTRTIYLCSSNGGLIPTLRSIAHLLPS